MTLLEAVNKYQAPGAVNEFRESEVDAYGWKKHVPGTFMTGVGALYLGMPKGFNRAGPFDGYLISRHIWIFDSWEKVWPYGKFNVPVWKYLDEHGNTLVRGLSPRTNAPFLHVILGDHRSKIACLEITAADLEKMD